MNTAVSCSVHTSCLRARQIFTRITMTTTKTTTLTLACIRAGAHGPNKQLANFYVFRLAITTYPLKSIAATPSSPPAPPPTWPKSESAAHPPGSHRLSRSPDSPRRPIQQSTDEDAPPLLFGTHPATSAAGLAPRLAAATAWDPGPDPKVRLQSSPRAYRPRRRRRGAWWWWCRGRCWSPGSGRCGRRRRGRSSIPRGVELVLAVGRRGGGSLAARW